MQFKSTERKEVLHLLDSCCGAILLIMMVEHIRLPSAKVQFNYGH